MKNHWLDKKIDKEIDKAFEEFKNTDFIDLSCVTQHNDSYNDYKEYDELELQEKFIEENVKALDPFDFEEHDRAVVTEILLKYKDKSHWIDEVLADVGYYGHTIDTTNEVMFDADDNFTITLGDKWPDCTINTNTVSGNPPGGDGIIWGGEFIQNETLQVYQDRNEDNTQFITTHTPVLPGTMTGTIYPTPGNHSYGFVFTVSTDGNFDYWQFLVDDNGQIEYPDETPLTDEEYLQKMVDGDNKFIGWYDEFYADKSTLNCQTGILDIHYRMGKRPEIIVSYEYQKVDSL